MLEQKKRFPFLQSIEQDFFPNLPSEITTNILSRLPLQSIAISKCVCKPWLNLLESDYFVKFRLSTVKTPAVLLRLTPVEINSIRCTIFEIEAGDEADLERHNLHYIPLTDFDIPHGKSALIAGIAANGLLLLYSELHYSEIPVYICNPLTRQYIELCCPEEYISHKFSLSYGFGVSKISGQYKVVCINRNNRSDSHHVYTLGTGTWRRVEAGSVSGCRFRFGGHIECNGNLHWILYDSKRPLRICGFDIETECFSVFSAPTGVGEVELNVLKDCLCISYKQDNEIVIWSMKEYQVEESWTIEYKLSALRFGLYWKPNFDCDKNIVKRLIYLSNKTRTTIRVGRYEDAAAVYYLAYATISTPSLFSLRSFGFENVKSF